MFWPGTSNCRSIQNLKFIIIPFVPILQMTLSLPRHAEAQNAMTLSSPKNAVIIRDAALV